MQNCLVLNTLKNYMLKTTNFVRNIELVRKLPLVSSLGLMDSYFEKISCVPNCSMRELLVQGITWLGINGTFWSCKDFSYFPGALLLASHKPDVERICGRCVTCRQAKSKVQPNDGKRKADFVKQIHEKARLNIERRTEQYATQANKGRRNLVFEPVMETKELDMLIIHMGMELKLRKTLCHFLVAQLEVLIMSAAQDMLIIHMLITHDCLGGFVGLSSSSEALAIVLEVAGIGRDLAGDIPGVSWGEVEVLIMSAEGIGSSAEMG
jgi:hypothetical protein